MSIPEVTVVKVFRKDTWWEKDLAGTVHIKQQHEGCEPFDYIQIQYDYAYTSNGTQYDLTREILKLLGVDDVDAAQRPYEPFTGNDVLRCADCGLPLLCRVCDADLSDE